MAGQRFALLSAAFRFDAGAIANDLFDVSNRKLFDAQKMLHGCRELENGLGREASHNRLYNLEPFICFIRAQVQRWQESQNLCARRNGQ